MMGVCNCIFSNCVKFSFKHMKLYLNFSVPIIAGVSPCSKDVFVHVKVIDRSMPVFEKQFYTVSVPENIELFSPLDLSISAESALGRKLIYSIVNGNDFEEFAVDFNSGK